MLWHDNALDFLETARVFHSSPYATPDKPVFRVEGEAVPVALAEEAEIGLSECRQLAEVRAPIEREKACLAEEAEIGPRCSGQHRKSRSWMKSDLGQA